MSMEQSKLNLPHKPVRSGEVAKVGLEVGVLHSRNWFQAS